MYRAQYGGASDTDKVNSVVKMTDCVDGVDMMGGSSLPRRMEDLGLEEKLDRTLVNAGEHYL